MGIKFLLRTSLLAGLLALSGIASAADLVLAANGKSDYQIVVPDASPSPEIGQWLEQTARLIQDAFQANGCEVSVAPEGKRDPAKPGIYLGDTAFARAHGVTVQTFPDWRNAQPLAFLAVALRDGEVTEGSSSRILVVDDDPETYVLLAEMLGQEFHDAG